MKSNQTFSIIFWMNKSKPNYEGKCPLWCRVTVNGERAEISIKQNIEPELWNSEKGKVKGNGREIETINTYLLKEKNKLNDIYTRMCNEGKLISAYNIKSEYLGNKEQITGLIEIAKSCLAFVENEIGKTYAQGTVKNYYSTVNLLEEFVKTKFGKSDIDIKQIKAGFILDFKLFLTTRIQKRPCHQNGYIKHFQRIKRIISYAIIHEWIDKNPFLQIKEKPIQKEKVYLTEDEMKKIEVLELPKHGLGFSRDIFLFSCYTGLAFCDLMELTTNDITLRMDRRKWIYIKRKKSNVDSLIPVLGKAEQIISNYKDFSPKPESGRIFPAITNQAHNRNLKTIFSFVGINKIISSHKARHTFATTICANNGVPIDTAAKMMGHRDLKTTQIYYQTTPERMSKDIDGLEQKLKNNNKKQKRKLA